MGNRSLDEFLDVGGDGSPADDTVNEDGGVTDDSVAAADEERGTDDAVEDEDGEDADSSRRPAGGGNAGVVDEHEQSGGAQAGTGDAEAVDPADDAAVDPARSTSRWNGNGLACPACGSTVTRLWREDDGHVCAACKDW